MLRILTAIEAKPGVTARQLAESCEASERTIYRDLDILRQGGIPLYADNGYRLAGDFFLPPVKLTLTEGMALTVAAGTLSKHHGVPYADAVRAALDKVTAALNPAVREAVVGQGNAVDYGGLPVVDYAGQQKLFALIEKARADQTTVELKYASAGRSNAKARLVDPYGFIFRNERWYLVAHCHWRGEIKLFRIDRISEAAVTDRAFIRPPNFQLLAYMGSAWSVVRGNPRKVVVRFSGDAARMIGEGKWHATQKISSLPDGCLEFSAEVADPAEMLPWILGFGAEAEIIEPAQLKRSAAEWARSVLDLYS